MTLARLLADAAARAPERPALAFEGERITYAELDVLASRAAGALRALGISAGDPVALVLPNTAESVAAFHGILRLGAVPVPLNPLLGATEVERRVAESKARLVAAEDLTCGDPAVDLAAAAHDDPAAILYTSGTAGVPKRVELTHGGLRLGAEATADALGLRSDDVLLGAAPLSHVLGLTACMNAAIAASACLALVPRFEAASALETIVREQVTVFIGVPAMCASLLSAAAEAPSVPALRLAHVGGAPLAAETAHSFERRFGARVLQGYGMTEAGGAITIARADRPAKPGSVGTPIAGQLRIAADGEVVVRAPTLARDHDGWLATGDIGRLDEDGELFLLDRKKDVILRGGYSVYPSEVEAALVAHPCVREAVVLGLPHPTLGEEVAALVVSDTPCDPGELKTFVRDRLASYAYPRLIELVEELPHGPTGKIDRRAINREALSARLPTP